MNYKKIIILVLLMFGLFTAFGCKKQKYKVVFDTDGGTKINTVTVNEGCLLYTSPSPRDRD